MRFMHGMWKERVFGLARSARTSSPHEVNIQKFICWSIGEPVRLVEDGGLVRVVAVFQGRYNLPRLPGLDG